MSQSSVEFDLQSRIFLSRSARRMTTESLNLKVVNISVKDGVKPKDFNWNELKIDGLADL
jgi:hypothetical protein